MEFEHRTVKIPVHDIQHGHAVNTILDLFIKDLAKTNQVYLRRPPEIQQQTNDNFEQTLSVLCRYSFKPEQPFGITKTNRAYDNDNMLSSFGLLGYGTSGSQPQG